MLKAVVIIGLFLFAFWVIKYLSTSQQNKIVASLIVVLGTTVIVFMGMELFR